VLGDDERAAEDAAKGVVGHLALQAPAGEVVIAGEVEAESVAAVSASHCLARFRTEAARTSGMSGGRPARRYLLKNTPSRSPARVTSIPSKAPSSSTASITTVAARM
jgi:hypothetical protein